MAASEYSVLVILQKGTSPPPKNNKMVILEIIKVKKNILKKYRTKLKSEKTVPHPPYKTTQKIDTF